jgi:hypothetical protein
MVAGVDRDTDLYDEKRGTPHKLNLPGGVCDLDMLRRLYVLTAGYMGNGGVPYTSLPGMQQPWEHNSNSYARALARAAGFTNVPSASWDGFRLPGWNNPVPASAFGGR